MEYIQNTGVQPEIFQGGIQYFFPYKFKPRESWTPILAIPLIRNIYISTYVCTYGEKRGASYSFYFMAKYFSSKLLYRHLMNVRWFWGIDCINHKHEKRRCALSCTTFLCCMIKWKVSLKDKFFLTHCVLCCVCVYCNKIYILYFTFYFIRQ